MVNRLGERVRPQANVVRVVQFGNTRKSFRLEAVFWDALARMAREKGVRLGKLIGALAEDFAGGNLTSHLRVACMLQAQAQLARLAVAASPEPFERAFRACPAGGLLLNPESRILAQNEALELWLGPDHAPVVGERFADVFRVRHERPFAELWESLVSGRRRVHRFPVLYMSPGRVSAAEATLMAIGREPGGSPFALAWLASRGSRPVARQAPT